MANVPRSRLSTSAISCLSTAHPQFIIFPSKLRDYWNTKLILPGYHFLPFCYDYKLSFCLFAPFPAAFSSFHDLTCLSVTPDYSYWVPAVLWGTKQELLLNSVSDEENGSYLWLAFQKMYGRVQEFCQSLKIKGKKKNLKENVWNGNVRTECWSLNFIPLQLGGALPLTWVGAKWDPHKFPGTVPKLGIFGRRSMLLLSSFWRTDFLCTPQYMVLGYVPKLLEPSSAKLFRIICGSQKKV